MLTAAASVTAQETAVPNVVLGIHGGAGLPKKEMTPELEKHLRVGLERALKEGYAALQKPNATSLDGVETAIRILEDDPWFNAGRGAVFTHDGRNELDASIMEGRLKKAGAVAGVTTIKNPITAARAVMERTKHVMLISRGAEVFAKDAGLEIVDPAYFRTEQRWKQLQDQLREEREAYDKKKREGAALAPLARPYELSTVGAVAVDGAGNLAAGTSTGGMSNKQYGRIGDSPVIGAGTYADNKSCAVSCTGHGEFFIRYAVSHDIAVLMEYKGLSVQQAADEVIRKKLKAAGGEGAAIALDPKGNFAMSHNTEGLYRGFVTVDGKMTVMLYEK
ncbi:MAG: isoaspartyl peptidase/L-asparaginase [Planctomycetia bacterium]|nr:isoaspartyl peptidase/L-asparaginase [Planctomycetia bacterium]